MRDGDAFGAALLDWAGGGADTEVIERDDGHVEEGAGAEIYLSPEEEWPAAERASLEHLSGRVVDAGCGAGRVARVLQDRGVDVVGIDASALAVRAARAVGVRVAEHRTMDELTAAIDRFDSILLYGNNFGVWGTPERTHHALTQWAGHARPGTRIFAESTNPYFGGAPIVDREYCRRNKARGLPLGQTTFRFRYKDVVGPWTTWLFASKGQLRAITRGTGWDAVDFLEDGRDQPFVAILERS